MAVVIWSAESDEEYEEPGWVVVRWATVLRRRDLDPDGFGRFRFDRTREVWTAPESASG